MSLREVEDLVKKRNHGICPGKTTIHRYVAELGLVGMSPLKTGPEGNIPRDDYKMLCAAYGSCLRINQINGRGGLRTQKFVDHLGMEATTTSN